MAAEATEEEEMVAVIKRHSSISQYQAHGKPRSQ